MFIKKTKNARGTTYLHLAEGYREGGKVKQRILLSLGREDGQGVKSFLSACASYNGQSPGRVKLSVEQTYLYGPLLVIRKIFERFGIDKICENIQSQHPRLEFDLKKILFTLVASRFIAPCSKLGIFDGLIEDFYPEFSYENLQLHQIYRTLDILHAHKVDIERELFRITTEEGKKEIDIFLYDLTTLRFESTREDIGELGRFGYSKEMRSDCTQVILALLVDKKGTPLGFEVFPGNTFEGNTVSNLIKKLKEHFKVRQFILVGDRGIFSQSVINQVTEAGGEFIIGMKVSGKAADRDGFYDLSRYETINEDLKLLETTHKGQRCIALWTQQRADRDRKTRESILSKINKKLSAKKVTSKTFISNQNYRRYLQNLSSVHQKPSINEAAIKEAEKHDGFFFLKTNVANQAAKELIFNYKQLWRIENAFGELKGTLKARPIFHWTDKRIIGHLVMCFVAYYCEAQITQTLKVGGTQLTSKAAENGHICSRNLTAVQAMKQLSSIRALPIQLGNQTKPLWVCTEPKENAAALLSALNIQIPSTMRSCSL